MYKKTQFIGISLLLLFLFAMLSGIYQGKLNNFLIIFNIIGFYGAGLYFSRVKENLVIIKILLVSITIIFCFYFVNTIPQTHWVTHSQNHISVIIIFLTGMYYLNILNIGEKSLPIYPAIVAFSISVMAIGRSGILVSPLFFLGLILAHAKKGYIIKTIFLISFVLIVAWYLFESNNLYRYIIFNRFYDVGIDSEARTMIIDYWKNNVMYVKSFLFGVDLTSLKEIYQLSSHNSFISIHSRFGIGSIIIVFQILKILKNSYKNNFMYFTILITILLRSISDSVLISSTFLFGILFYSLLFSSETKQLKFMERPDAIKT